MSHSRFWPQLLTISSSFQSIHSDCRPFSTCRCNLLNDIELHCPACYPIFVKQEQFNNSLPWGSEQGSFEDTEFQSLKNLEQLTIELCDWDFRYMGRKTLQLIKNFLQNCPVTTLVFRIRLKQGSYMAGRSPQAITNPDPDLVRLIQAIAKIATLRGTEIFEGNGRKRVGAELRLTFTINQPTPAAR